MVCQFEDCVDDLKILHPTYHFLFLFDQSSGYSKQRPDGLNATRMNKSFGGRNTLMRETKIETVQGYLGTYNSILHPGDTQCLTFLQSDQGPFWLTPTQAELCRHDVVIGTKNADRNRLSLTMDLLSKGVNTKGKSKRELVELCTKNAIETKELIERKKVGWVSRRVCYRCYGREDSLMKLALKNTNLLERTTISESLTILQA